ncbi:YgiQ family radical SAM protein [Ethanoligenens sp.]|uniref:YgiQ family radical SAM protein n=1 Tax=Ethanoligenens sp. TaxID=2099655 RepID=UPI0039EA9C02
MFLPISQADMQARGLHYLDFICVTGDAYVDHPSFGIAIVSRVLEAAGFTVGILAQPDFHDTASMTALGRPRYGFFVTGGNIDSMVAHYTVAKRPRGEDLYSPGGKPHRRPDRATLIYTRLLKEAYPDCPVIIGGLEASLRRFAQYDYWADKVLPSILPDAGADLLVFGMGERQTIEIAKRLAGHEKANALQDIRGTCYFTKELPMGDFRFCPSFDEVRSNKKSYARACRIQYDEQDAVIGKALVQRHPGGYLVQNRPAMPLETEELDRVYALPYMRTWHPSYAKEGGVPAIEEVLFSITHNRGCFGACNFCSIAFHQGRAVTSRSETSLLAEAKELVEREDFKGYIHDVGGPTANFRAPSCEKQKAAGLCKGKKCLAPKPCPQLHVSHAEYLGILRKLRMLPGVKRVFIRSGIRYDYLMLDKDEAFFKELVRYHVSGQLKVAPEHCSSAVLDKMGKPHIEAYLAFAKRFYSLTKAAGKEQYLVPYLMSSHPGSTLKDAVELAVFLKRERIRPEQVQDFYPTPGTISTCIFYTGLDPYTEKPVFVPRTPEEKAMQRALLQYFNPKNRALVEKALIQSGRRDLIGNAPDCLIRPSHKPHPTNSKTVPHGQQRTGVEKTEKGKAAWHATKKRH